MFWASGFSFSRSNVLLEVPYDPLPHLFFGEESIMTVRLWTSGFDFFATTEAVAYHLWKRNYRPNFQELHVDSEKALEKISSREKVLRTLSTDVENGEDTYGLGTVRSLRDFQNFSGVNFGERSLEEKSLLGGQTSDIFSGLNQQELVTSVSQAQSGKKVVPPSTIDSVLAVLSARGDI